MVVRKRELRIKMDVQMVTQDEEKRGIAIVPGP